VNDDDHDDADSETILGPRMGSRESTMEVADRTYLTANGEN